MAKPTILRPNGQPTLSSSQAECIQLLEDALASAKNGEISTCLLIACGASDFGMAFAGPDAAKLNLGLDVAKRTILERASPQGGGRTVLHR